jgi:hypothetical protein
MTLTNNDLAALTDEEVELDDSTNFHRFSNQTMERPHTIRFHYHRGQECKASVISRGPTFQ